MRKISIIGCSLMLLCLLGIVSSCGYGFTQNSFLPPDIHSVYIEAFINRSRDIGIEKELTAALRNEFYRRSTLRVVASAGAQAQPRLQRSARRGGHDFFRICKRKPERKRCSPANGYPGDRSVGAR